MRSTRQSNIIVGGLCVLGITAMASIPYFLRMNSNPLYSKDGPLTGTQRQRGMYVSSGTDVGLDPNWDQKEGKYKGYKSHSQSFPKD
mmetsp:Transcript_888/g.531  ORF Transcript_888/g.531 Transcript_888/m.531 type:complete len:87 (-) Transcript_888:94-354(-)